MTDTDTRRPNQRLLAKTRTREKVMSAAKALFDRNGYHGATIRSIASVVGMSTGAIFANFEDKAALYQAIYGHKPLTEDVGRKALIILRAMTMIDEQADEHGREIVDEVQGMDIALIEATELLHATGAALLSFNDMAEKKGKEPDEMTYADGVRAALETPLWAAHCPRCRSRTRSPASPARSSSAAASMPGSFPPAECPRRRPSRNSDTWKPSSRRSRESPKEHD